VDLPGLAGQIDVLGNFVLGGVLQQIAASLTACARPADTIARIAPERFAILMPDTDEPASLLVAATVRAMLGRFELPKQGRIRATLELNQLRGGSATAAADVLAACETRLAEHDVVSSSAA
jgi:GGDEF domain-containing protein